MSKGLNTALSPNQIRQCIEALMKAKLPVFLWGQPGIGKSDIVHQIGEANERPVIDMRLLLMEPTDLKGIPFFDPESKTMRWAQPNELPRPGEKTMENAILFLDELNAAPPSVQAAAFQLILNRKVGQYELPKGVDIVAAGNRESDKGVTYRMPTPLANRFTHLEMQTEFKDWQAWAVNNLVHADVVGYLTNADINLNKFDPKSPDKAFATPRTWSFVGRILDQVDKGHNISEGLLTSIIAGQVGTGIAGEFMIHRRTANSMPATEDILKGKVKELDSKMKREISAQWALITRCAYRLQSEFKDVQKMTGKDRQEAMDELDKRGDAYIWFLLKNLSAEMVVFGAMTVLRTYDVKFTTSRMSSFKELTARHKDIILGSRNEG